MINSILIAAPNNFSTQDNIPRKLQGAEKKRNVLNKTKSERKKNISHSPE